MTRPVDRDKPQPHPHPNAPPRFPRASAEMTACPVDLSITCPTCSTLMQPEHAHYRCPKCGYRDSCCF